MTDPTLPPSLAAELADLKRRLANLERSPSIPFSSTRGGAFQFLDDAGAARFTLGNVDIPVSPSPGAGPQYGAFLYGDGGAVALGAQEGNRGLVYPLIPAVFYDADVLKTVSLTSFVTVWECYVDTAPGEVIYVQLLGHSTVSNGSVRLTAVGSGSTDEAVLVPSSSHNIIFDWLHPGVTGWGDTRPSRPRDLLIRVEAKAGAGGTVVVGAPVRAYFASTEFRPSAAANGNPMVI